MTCHITLLFVCFLVAYMGYYMVTIRERCDDINNKLEEV